MSRRPEVDAIAQAWVREQERRWDRMDRILATMAKAVGVDFEPTRWPSRDGDVMRFRMHDGVLSKFGNGPLIWQMLGRIAAIDGIATLGAWGL